MVTRTQKILNQCNTGGKGLEVAPSFSPICPKRDGYNVETIDHLNKEGLKKKYAGHGFNLEAIEDVDYVWSGEKYSDLTGKANHYDYIVASHVIEHVCDLIGFINDCEKMLSDEGILALAIPDKRYTFDYFRPLSSISKAIDCHLNNQSLHSPGTILENYLNIVKNNDKIWWTPECIERNFSSMHTIEVAKNFLNESLKQNEYMDAHSWIFTKSSFELMIYDLNCLGYTNLRVIEIYDVEGNEFVVSLRKQKDNEVRNENKRLKLFQNIERELSLNMALDSPIFKEYIERIHNSYIESTSWRITKPIRSIKHFFISLREKAQRNNR